MHILERLAGLLPETRGPLAEAQSQYLIGDLAKALGVESPTLRFYEKIGLLKPRRVGRLRVYEEQDVTRLRLIKFLRDADLSLRDIKLLMSESADIRDQQEVLQLLSRKIEELALRQQEISAQIVTFRRAMDPSGLHGGN